MAASGSAASLKDRIRSEYAVLLDNYANLVKAAKVHEAGDLPGAGRVPGKLVDVFAEKMLGASRALLEVTGELKRNVLLNDVEGRNAEVAAARVGASGDGGGKDGA